MANKQNPKQLKPGTKVKITGFASHMDGFDSLKKGLFPNIKFPINAVTIDEYGDDGDSIVKFPNEKTASLLYFNFEK